MKKLLFSITILLSATLLFVLYIPCVRAAGGLSVDKKFDLTGDGIVDASDWARMTKEARRAYAYASVKALGENPDAKVDGKTTRGQRYLQGLRSVYQ